MMKQIGRLLRIKWIGCIVAAVLPLTAPAEEMFYVRSGATGSSNGADWANAFPSLPSSLQRGATYYIADGSYGGYNFDDAADQSLRIEIKKANAADHGTDSGWDSSYGDGFAVFAPLRFQTGYYTFDGQTGGGPGSWKSGFGFKIKATSGGQKIVRGGGDHVTIRHVEMEHRGLDTDTSDDGIYIPGDNWLVSRCYLHDFGRAPVLLASCQNWTLQYSCIARNSSSAEQHSEAISDSGSDQATIRYNVFEDIEGTGVIVVLSRGGTAASDNWDIYGNVFYWTPDNPFNRGSIADGVVTVINEQQASDWEIYNNNIVNVPSGSINAGVSFRESTGSGRYVYNNIWYNNTANSLSFAGEVTHDWNWFYENRDGRDGSLLDEELASAETHGQVGDGNPFVGWKQMDFHLTGATDSGTGLEDPFAHDPDGVVRGSDGIWDRGAFEFGGESDTSPAPPSNLRVVD